MGRKKTNEPKIDCSTLSPYFERMRWAEAPTPEDKKISSGEIMLWRKVVIIALLDFCNTSDKADAKFNRLQAEHWLLKNEGNFRAVCAFADINAEKLREMVRGLLKANFEELHKIKIRMTKL